MRKKLLSDFEKANCWSCRKNATSFSLLTGPGIISKAGGRSCFEIWSRLSRLPRNRCWGKRGEWVEHRPESPRHTASHASLVWAIGEHYSRRLHSSKHLFSYFAWWTQNRSVWESSRPPSILLAPIYAKATKKAIHPEPKPFSSSVPPFSNWSRCLHKLNDRGDRLSATAYHVPQTTIRTTLLQRRLLRMRTLWRSQYSMHLDETKQLATKVRIIYTKSKSLRV